MKSGRLVVVLLVLILAALIGVQWWMLPDPDRRNFEFFPNMVESLARDAQSPPLILDDGTVIDRRIPSDSVVRGHMPLMFDATPEGALLAGAALTNPIAADDQVALVRGAFIFNNYCIVCHGTAGLGDGPVTKRGVPPPPSFLLDNALNMKDGQMFHILTLGQKNMASYASQITQEDRWKVIRYVRTLQVVPEAVVEATP